MAQQGKVVAVTGASGYVGAKLLERLEQEPGLRKLVAFDVNPLVVPVHNIAVYRKDVSQPIDDELNDQGATTLVHLAFNARRGANGREVAAIREENVETLRSVMASCARSRVNHLIFLSSHTVYGAHSDNPVPIVDDAPMRPSPDHPYAYDKHLCELALEEFAQAQQDIKITTLRSCAVLGHGADNFATKAFFRSWLFGVLDYDPPLQFVYDDDLARVMSIIIQQEIPGTFNVAGDGVVHYREMAKIIQSKLINLPPFLAYPLVRLCRGIHLQREATVSGLDQARWPILMSTGKLHKATGYRFWHTALETLTAFANSGYLYKDPVPF
ncbi:MAG: NAD-dependent epimerase/dehydratase family protein [Chloroflexi bacterium]|nr:NAD-dependent epimerase/dehydratase family protein [Chloroflexota bacterium]